MEGSDTERGSGKGIEPDGCDARGIRRVEGPSRRKFTEHGRGMGTGPFESRGSQGRG